MGLGTGFGRVVPTTIAPTGTDRRRDCEPAEVYLRRLAETSTLGPDLPRGDVLRALREVIGDADDIPVIPRPRRSRAHLG